MYYVASNSLKRAVIFYDEKEIKKYYDKYLTVESIPEGTGMLMCDSEKIWYETLPEPEKEITIADLQQENKLLKAQLKAQTERSDFIEDCIAEMAEVVYNTEETTT